MKKLLFLILGLSVPSFAVGPIISYVQLSTGATQSGGLNLSTGTFTTGLTLPYLTTPGQCVTVNGSGQTGLINCGSGSSVNSPFLAVNQSGVQVSSPTKSINVLGTDIQASLVGGSTAQLTINPAYSGFIHNQSSPQSGAQLNLSSGTITQLQMSVLTSTGGPMIFDFTGDTILMTVPYGYGNAIQWNSTDTINHSGILESFNSGPFASTGTLNMYERDGGDVLADMTGGTNTGKLFPGDFLVRSAVAANEGTPRPFLIGYGRNQTVLIEDTATVDYPHDYPFGGAVFQSSSSTRGSLPYPRLTSTQEAAISPVIEGLGVHNTTTPSLDIYHNSQWDSVGFIKSTQTWTAQQSWTNTSPSTFTNLNVTTLTTTNPIHNVPYTNTINTFTGTQNFQSNIALSTGASAYFYNSSNYGGIGPAQLQNSASGTSNQLTINGGDLNIGGDHLGVVTIVSSTSVSGYFQLASYTHTRITSLTPPAVGEEYYCSDCATVGVCISTGTTPGAFGLITNKGSICQ